jgi:hypothetical protein
MSDRIEQPIGRQVDESEAFAEDELCDEALDRTPGLCHCVGGTNYCI